MIYSNVYIYINMRARVCPSYLYILAPIDIHPYIHTCMHTYIASLCNYLYGKTLLFARKVRMEFKYYPSTCSKTCARPEFWYLPDDEP